MCSGIFNKYKSDYQVPTILDGKASDDIKERAKSAKFDERLALLGLLLDAVIAELRSVNLAELSLAELLTSLKVARVELAKSGSEPANAVQKQIDLLSKKIVNGKRASTLSTDDEYACYSTIAVLKDMVSILHKKSPISGIEAFKQLKTEFDKRSKTLKQQADTAGQELSNVFRFCEEVFDEGQELLILVTELTISRYGAHFISRYGCDEYFAHNKELVFYERQKEIILKTNYPVTPRQKRSRCRSNRGIIDSPTPLFTPFCRFRYRSRGQIHSHQYPRTSSTNDPFLKWFSYASRMMRIAMSTSPF